MGLQRRQWIGIPIGCAADRRYSFRRAYAFRFSGKVVRIVFPEPFGARLERDVGLGFLRILTCRFASIHLDIATEDFLAVSGTVTPFSRAIASAKDICAGLGNLFGVSPAVRSPKLPVL